jgi:hypothetical protein
MPEQVSSSPRPVWIPVLVSLLYVAGLVHLVYMFTGAYAPYGNFYPAVLALLTVMGFAGLSGVMSAEKWGVWVFSVAAAGIIAASAWAGVVAWPHLLLAVPVLVFLSRIRTMH